MDYNFFGKWFSRNLYLAITICSCFIACLKTLQGFNLNNRG